MNALWAVGTFHFQQLPMPPSHASGTATEEKKRQGSGGSSDRGDSKLSPGKRNGALHVPGGAEEHWNAVMKKLSPAGYSHSPAWQRSIIERVVQKMTTRPANTSRVAASTRSSLTRTVDLGAIGIAPETAAALQAEEERVAQTMLETSVGSLRRGSTAGQLPAQRDLAERQNQVHTYARAIQMEQLQEQELDTEMQQMNAAVVQAERAAGGSLASMMDQKAKAARQVAIIQNRCTQLAKKASETVASNQAVRREVDRLRREKVAHQRTLERLSAKSTKMDEDIVFLTQAAHDALDQREKVKSKFMALQRDVNWERKEKLSQIKDVASRTSELEGDWGVKERELAEAEEERRRREYISSRSRRGELERAETRFGFLANQALGWDAEFERLQSFSGMDEKYQPGEDHIVDSIANRFLEKERSNTSLQRYLHEQQSELAALTGERRRLESSVRELHDTSEGLPADERDGESSEGVDSGQNHAGRGARVEALLAEAGVCVERITQSMWKGGAPCDADEACSTSSIEAWLQRLDVRVAEVRGSSAALVALAKEVNPVLVEWCGARQPKRHVSTPDIHEALLLQAQRQEAGVA